MDAEDKKFHKLDFDRWLDDALRGRVEAEPRMGLEDRVLARIAGAPPTEFVWWRAIAVAAAVVVIGLALVLLRPNQRGLTSANLETRPPDSAAVESAPAQRKPTPNSSTIDVRRTFRNRVAGRRPANELAGRRRETERLPKLATFPAPRPATAEERMLAQLATQLAAQRQFSEIANLSIDAAPKDLSIRELTVEPLETAPADSGPQQ